MSVSGVNISFFLNVIYGLIKVQRLQSGTETNVELFKKFHYIHL